MKKPLIILFLLATVSLFSQERWQQWIDYKIDVNLSVETDKIMGKEVIRYFNNSPDTLREIYFHLYWNAFKPGSYMNIKSINTNRENRIRLGGLNAEEQGDVKINNILVDGETVRTEEHGTILKVLLNNSLFPNKSVVIALDFFTQVPKLIRRAGRDSHQGVRYSMAQWYPKICEYDFEGWHYDQYAGREFYGVWGNFDVKITLDANYVVGASGVIQNPQEVKCGYELGNVNFTWKKSESDTFPKGATKTWHFKADTVHDFAWVADEKYMHDIFFWNDVTIHTLYIPSFQIQYRSVKYYVSDMLDFYSERYGNYPYKQFTVAQAGDGGMEYPNIVFNASGSPGLVAHEGGHNWFYGLLGNNESREAWLDEGFITYTTDEMMKDKYRSPDKFTPEGISNIFTPPYDINGNYRTYWQIAKLGIEEPILTHSDYFKDDMVYAFEVYSKGGMVLPMLEYVIGENAFNQTMKTYFDKWHFKHPHSSDFQRIAEKESGMELDWFFDEWLTTTKTCDYAINSFDGRWINENGKNIYRIKSELENKDDVIMPVDLTLTLKSGKVQNLIIPVGWGTKQEKNAILLPRWKWVDKKYSFIYDFDEEVVAAEIDPSLRMKDLNRLNNTSGFLPKLDIHFIRPIQLNPPVDAYWINYKPYLWYSVKDGLKPGIIINGGYLGGEFAPPDYSSRLGLFYCSKSNQIDFDLGYASSIPDLGKNSYFSSIFSKLNGIRYVYLKIDKLLEPFSPVLSKEQKAGITFEHYKLIEDDYPQYNLMWEKGSLNTIQMFYIYKQNRPNLLKFFVNTEIGFNSIKDYSKFTLEVQYKIPDIPFINFRFFTGFSSTLPPTQKQFNLTSANADEQYNSQFYRDLFGLNGDFPHDVDLGFEGGGNLKGYIPKYSEYNGKNILAINIETSPVYPFKITTIPVLSDIKSAIFLDAGNIWNDSFKDYKGFLNNCRYDGGILFEWNPFESSKSVKSVFPILKDFIIRFNLPLWISHTDPDKRKFDWRWNITIGKVMSF